MKELRAKAICNDSKYPPYGAMGTVTIIEETSPYCLFCPDDPEHCHPATRHHEFSCFYMPKVDLKFLDEVVSFPRQLELF
ncbi:MAG: hypothetical protein F6K58_19880 [Symploca sp. SIO2E9]|nr:hypothetical protein [Symploca sp. SIO2E9]